MKSDLILSIFQIDSHNMPDIFAQSMTPTSQLYFAPFFFRKVLNTLIHSCGSEPLLGWAQSPYQLGAQPSTLKDNYFILALFLGVMLIDALVSPSR